LASPAMRRVMDLTQRAARVHATVLITGETGSGKEVVARAIHHYSVRARCPWVDVNCGALPENLMESELFGHEKGAFSSADTARPGLFELAHTGTLFLDEVGELEPRMQVKLLRVLDGVPYYRVGGRKKITVDTRVVAATNQDLEAAVARGRFREDLYHRLNQVGIRVPALRERPEDIAPIAEHFLRLHSPSAELSEEAQALLRRYAWPGNVRELRNAITRAVVSANGDVLTPEEFPDLREKVNGKSAGRAPAVGDGSLSLEDLERQAILEAMRQTRGHQQKSADALGISRRTLSRKLKLYRMNPQADSAYVS